MSEIMQKKQIYVIKASGQKVPFDPRKIEATCIRAGASKKIAEQIAKNVHGQTPDNARTREVYRMVLNALASIDKGQIIKHRYRLKEYIMVMGPAGFAFEIYLISF